MGHFQASGGLVPEIVQIGFQRLIFRLLAAWCQKCSRLASRGSFSSFWRPGARNGPDWLPEAHFQASGGLVPEMLQTGFQRLIFKLLETWCQKWSRLASRGSFSGFWRPGARNAPDWLPETHFQASGDLVPEMVQIGFQRLIFRLLAAWCQKCSRLASRDSFSSFWRPGARNGP